MGLRPGSLAVRFYFRLTAGMPGFLFCSEKDRAKLHCLRSFPCIHKLQFLIFVSDIFLTPTDSTLDFLIDLASLSLMLNKEHSELNNEQCGLVLIEVDMNAAILLDTTN